MSLDAPEGTPPPQLAQVAQVAQVAQGQYEQELREELSNGYLSLDEGVQRPQTSSQTASLSLDAFEDVQGQNRCVQRPESAPRAENLSLDTSTSDTHKPQLAQVAQSSLNGHQVLNPSPGVEALDNIHSPEQCVQCSESSPEAEERALDAFPSDIEGEPQGQYPPQYEQWVNSAPRIREEFKQRPHPLSLDAIEDVQRQNECVQRPESAPRAENLSLDTASSDIPKPQLSQVAQDPSDALDAITDMFGGVVVPCPIQQTLDLSYSSRNDCQFQQYFQDTTRTVSEIKVGDKVRYVGRGEWGLFTIKGLWKEVLTVLAVDQDLGVARVTSPNWNFLPNYQTIDLKYLKKI